MGVDRVSRCRHEFLKRGHSKDYGRLDISNWGDITSKRVQRRIDPEILNLLLLLNEKGYKTYSACSGGHKADMRVRVGRHEDGYIAFSPPSRVAFSLYFALQRKNRRFNFRASFDLDNEDDPVEQTVSSELRWWLKDDYLSKRRYYAELFGDMSKIVTNLKPMGGKETLLKHALGIHAAKGQKLLDRQQRRFARES